MNIKQNNLDSHFLNYLSENFKAVQSNQKELFSFSFGDVNLDLANENFSFGKNSIENIFKLEPKINLLKYKKCLLIDALIEQVGSSEKEYHILDVKILFNFVSRLMNSHYFVNDKFVNHEFLVKIIKNQSLEVWVKLNILQTYIHSILKN